MQKHIAEKEQEEKRKSGKWGSFWKSFSSPSEEELSSYNFYLKKHKLNVIDVMECPICMANFKYEDKV